MERIVGPAEASAHPDDGDASCKGHMLEGHMAEKLGRTEPAVHIPAVRHLAQDGRCVAEGWG